MLTPCSPSSPDKNAIRRDIFDLPRTDALPVFSDETRAASLRVAAAFRAAGVPTEVHLGGGRIGKQLKAADQRGAPFAVVAGPDDLAAGQVVLKDLRGGGQRPCTLEEAVAAVVAAP